MTPLPPSDRERQGRTRRNNSVISYGIIPRISRQMTATFVIEYYRQFAFVSSVLAGFTFTFHGVLLSASAQHRATNLAALLAVMASIAFLLVTLGMTFAAAIAASLPNDAKIPSSILAQQTPLSFCFLVGIALLFAAFGLGGWIRSRSLGIAMTAVATVGLVGALAVLIPYLH